MYTDTHIIHDGPYPKPLAILLKIRKLVSPLGRRKWNKQIREKLQGVEFSILCNNCLGGHFYHDAGRKFTTPTINLAFDGPDFIRFLENPKHYLSCTPEFLPVKAFPLAMFDDVEVNFVHYHSDEEALDIWNRRKDRILWDNLFIIATDHDGMYLPEMMERFDKLPYKNKIMFTAKEYPQYPWAIQVKQFKHRNNVRIMTAFANMRGKRYYETAFDIAGWIRDCSKK